MENFLLGVLSSIIAALVTWISQFVSTRWGLFSLQDFWIEEVDGQDAGGPPDRVLISRVSYKGARGYEYSGISYSADGIPEWEWATVALVIARDQQRIFYVYRSWRVDSGAEEHFGFGVMNYIIRPEARRATIISGSFRGSLNSHVLHNRKIHRAKSFIKQCHLKRGNLRDRSYQKYVVKNVKQGLLTEETVGLSSRGR